MSMEQKLITLATVIGGDIKKLNLSIGDLSELPTGAKSTLVDALQELYELIQQGTSGGVVENGVQIDDTAGVGATNVTWSADKTLQTIDAMVDDAISAIIGDAPEALDTLTELADALGKDPNFAATIATGLSNRVRFDEAQVLSQAQRKQACDNLGIGDPEADLVGAYNTAKGK